MRKPRSSLPAPTGLAEWLPLLGSICQVLAALGEEQERREIARETGDTKALPAARPGAQTG